MGKGCHISFLLWVQFSLCEGICQGNVAITCIGINRVSLTVFTQGEVVTFVFGFNQGFIFLGKVVTFGF